MKHCLILLLFAAFSLAFCQAFAQQQPAKASPADTATGKIFTFADTNPEYPGGQDALLEFLGKQLQFVNMIGKPEGLVVLQFVVTETGIINDISVLRSLHPELDSAAVHAVKAMPNWIPGTKDGRIVKVGFTLPVRFSKTMGKSKSRTKSKK